MNNYIFIRRLRGPAILLLIGVLELLHTTGIIGSFWHLFWPLLLIMLGILLLAERAAMSADEGYPPPPFAGPYDPSSVPPGSGVPPTPAQPSTSIVPAPNHDFGNGHEGGQL
jgi:hypothetical protein